MLAIVHRDLGDAHVAGLLQRVEQQGVRLFAGFVRRHVVGGFEEDRVHLVGLDEFLDLHDLGRRGRDLLDLFVLDHHVAVFFVLVALDDFAARDRLVLGRAVEHLLDPRAVGFVELVEADAFAARRAVQSDWERHQPEGEMPFPNCRRHTG